MGQFVVVVVVATAQLSDTRTYHHSQIQTQRYGYTKSNWYDWAAYALASTDAVAAIDNDDDESGEYVQYVNSCQIGK